jgi:hypothetical protein
MLSKDFKEFAVLLNSIGVEYLVVGGYALAAHGHPRYTGDLDLWIRPVGPNVAKLLEALRQFGFGALGLNADEFQMPGAVVQMCYPPLRIDLLTGEDRDSGGS